MNITNSRLHKSFAVRLYAAFTIAALIISLLPLQTMVAEASDAINTAETAFDSQTNVTICHTGNGKNYTSNTPNVDSIVIGNSGHSESDPSKSHGLDIIPAFYWDYGGDSGYFPGQNWDADGIAVWNDEGCDGTPVSEPETVWLEISKTVYPGEFSGTLDKEDFEFTITGTDVNVTVAHGEAVELPVGTYSVTESYAGTDSEGFNAEDWTAEWDGDVCDLDDAIPAEDAGTLVVLDGDIGKFTEDNPARCTVSNTFDPAPVVATDMTFELVKKFSGPVPVGYTADQFTFNVEGVASDIPLTARTDDEAFATLTLEVGDYTLTENGPDGFVPEDWTILWSGAGCENITADGTTISIGSDDLLKDSFNCVADNQWKPTNTDVPGCTDEDANNYNADATYDDGSCTFDVVLGCTDSTATNYNPDATLGNADAQNCEYDTPDQCVPAAPGWADVVESSDQGETKGAGAIADPKRTDPEAALGAADWSDGGNDGFFSLGFGGSIVFSFGPDGFVTDEDGDDISIHEATNGDDYPEETALVEVSQDGSQWYEVGTASNLTDVSTRVSYFDIATTGLAWIKYVRVTDTTDPDLHVPAGDGFDLDAVDTTKTVCEEPKDDNGDGGDDGDAPTYLVYGYVWHDENENQVWEGFDEEESESVEPDLSGWKVSITNGTDSYSTTTDEDGYYEFWVPAGTWTISETLEDGWTRTYPAQNSHVVEVVDETLTAGENDSFFAMIMDVIIPTAHAQTPTSYGPYNFGNVFTGTVVTTSGGGGGGGSPAPRCDLFTAEVDGDEINFAWETRYGRDLTIDADGVEVYDETDDDVVEEGSFTIDNDGQTLFELTVYKGTRHDECVVELADSSSSANTPTPQVLGEQVSVVPMGAPDAGAGGTSPQIPSVAPWTAMLATTMRKNNAK